jgi:hypothetical protein
MSRASSYFPFCALYCHIISRSDTFFEGEEDVIAVFDFDYATMEEFDVKVGWAWMLFPAVLVLGTLCLQPCYMRKRVQWEVYSQHLCVTRDGIRFVKDKRPTLCGCACTDAGKTSKTVPFDKITDCDISEPAGATCICIENVLSTVNVDTASSGVTQEGGVRHELSIQGLKDPHTFKKLVWAMKRSNGATFRGSVSGLQASAAPSFEKMNRSAQCNENVPLLLQEIRDELREQTKLLKGREQTKL